MLKTNDIILACMPFFSIKQPSIRLGLLAAAAKKAHLNAAVVYPSLDFAEMIGFRTYFMISHEMYKCLFGEWVFAEPAYGKSVVSDEEYFKYFEEEEPDFSRYISQLSIDKRYSLENEFSDLRKKAGLFIKKTAEEIVCKKPKIVGSGSTFVQYNSSLAVLRKVKELDPSITTMLGGANCEGGMGLISLQNYPWIDYVVSGEADEFFADLCEKIMEKGSDVPADKLPYGVYNQNKLNIISDKNRPEIAIVKNIENLPVPDYYDYFEKLEKNGIRDQIKPIMVMESSRGCWKGEKNQCNFCGLNGKRISFRSKTPERILNEMDVLHKRHGITAFMMADAIMKMSYFNSLLKILSDIGSPYQIFFETVSGLNEKQVKLLSEAGINWIQTGIEGIQDDLLKLLNKGNSTIKNIALLKYSKEYGVNIFWNILYNFPGDKDEYYMEAADLIPLICHLQPPNLFRPVIYDRFSPYYEKKDIYKLSLTPFKAYKYVFPLEKNDMHNIAYFFKDDLCKIDEKMKKPGLRKLKSRIFQWGSLHYDKNKNENVPELTAREINGGLVISDTRPCAVFSEFTLTGNEKDIYKACRRPVSQAKLYEEFCENKGSKINEKELDGFLKKLEDEKLLLNIKNKYLSLALKESGKKLPDKNLYTDYFTDKFSFAGELDTAAEENTAWKWIDEI